jgi:AcrR family transcriptional regulator
MPSPATAPEPTSAKRAHLLATAQRLFYRDGYRSVGIDTLLAEAGVAAMTLYNHFASRDDLIVAVVAKLDANVRASLAGAVDAAGHSPTRQLLAVFDWLSGSKVTTSRAAVSSGRRANSPTRRIRCIRRPGAISRQRTAATARR